MRTKVVFEDTLGIAADLDAAMTTHVGGYEDEWAATLDDPEKLRKFAAFVNAPDTADPDLALRRGARPAAAGPRARSARCSSPATRLPVRRMEERKEGVHAHDVDQSVCAGRARVDRGAAALVDGHQVALFRLASGEVYAIDHQDPFSGANVLARGLVGTRGDVPTVASPVYKQVFDLTTGICLDDESACALAGAVVDASRSTVPQSSEPNLWRRQAVRDG